MPRLHYPYCTNRWFLASGAVLLLLLAPAAPLLPLYAQPPSATPAPPSTLTADQKRALARTALQRAQALFTFDFNDNGYSRELLARIAKVHALLGDPEATELIGALQEYGSRLSDSNDRMQLRAWIADAQFAAGDRLGAQETLRSAVENAAKNPYPASLLLDVAVVAEATGDTASARQLRASCREDALRIRSSEDHELIRLIRASVNDGDGAVAALLRKFIAANNNLLKIDDPNHPYFSNMQQMLVVLIDVSTFLADCGDFANARLAIDGLRGEYHTLALAYLEFARAVQGHDFAAAERAVPRLIFPWKRTRALIHLLEQRVKSGKDDAAVHAALLKKVQAEITAATRAEAEILARANRESQEVWWGQDFDWGTDALVALARLQVADHTLEAARATLVAAEKRAARDNNESSRQKAFLNFATTYEKSLAAPADADRCFAIARRIALRGDSATSLFANYLRVVLTNDRLIPSLINDPALDPDTYTFPESSLHASFQLQIAEGLLKGEGER